MKWQLNWPGTYLIYWKHVLSYLYLLSSNLKAFYRNQKCYVGVRNWAQLVCIYLTMAQLQKYSWFPCHYLIWWPQSPTDHLSWFQRHSEEQIWWGVVSQWQLSYFQILICFTFSWNHLWQKYKFFFLLTRLRIIMEMSCFLLQITREVVCKTNKNCHILTNTSSD